MEAGEASPRDRLCLRLLTPVAKLATARQAVAAASEALEGFGGAGYVEDTGLPVWLRDAQVLSIWEGTTNVLSLDVLRAVAREGALAAWAEDARARLERLAAGPLAATCGRRSPRYLDHVLSWFEAASRAESEALEAGGRRFAQAVAAARRRPRPLRAGQRGPWPADVRAHGAAARRWTESRLRPPPTSPDPPATRAKYDASARDATVAPANLGGSGAKRERR